MKQRFISLSGTGNYLPRHIMTPHELDIKLGKPLGWSHASADFKIRHIASDDETTSMMAAKAALSAINNAGIKLDAIDCIISACGLMEQPIPSTATLIKKQLGLNDSLIPAFDINSTCLSFLTALDTMSYMVDAGRFNTVLIVSSEIPSLGINWHDKESCTLFGDGAAAAIITRTDKTHSSTILASHMETYSAGADYCEVKAGGTLLHPTRYKGDPSAHTLFRMDGKAAYKISTQYIDQFIDTLMEKSGLKLKDIDCVIPHQASKLAMHHLRKKLGIEDSKLIDIFDTHGNQVAASIPTALDYAISRKRIKRGDKILLIGTSAGISLGGMVMEY